MKTNYSAPHSPPDHGLSQVRKQYRTQLFKRAAWVFSLCIAILVSLFFDVTTGPSDLSVSDALRAIFFPSEADRGTAVILWHVRLPYALMAVLVGAALSLAGAEMQTILNNPLASPFTLGISAAASLGAALAIILDLSLPFISQEWIVSGNAFLFAFGSVLLIQSLSRYWGARTETLVLFGIALVFSFNALVALLQFLASAEALQQFVFWSLGSLARSSWDKLAILVIIIAIVLPWSLSASWKLTALRLGEDRARSYGVNVVRLRFFSLLRVSLLAATAVAFVGTIGFVGLVGPHIARMLIGEDHRFLIPASALTGALVMSLASIASKALIPGVLMPVGIVTSLIGVPVFLYLIIRRNYADR